MPFDLPLVWLIIFGILIGAVIGSFLNVVIVRYPKMLQAEWKTDCAELAGETPQTTPRFNLGLPRSHCPHCKHNIAPKNNIPLISYFALRGKCADCAARISPQYPLVEWISTILTTLVLVYWGLSWQAAVSLLTLYFFIVLSFIDYNEHLLPDLITLSLLWLGLIWHIDQHPAAAVAGAVGGYLILWIINRIFLMIRSKAGMGHGDFKCLAAIGAWVGLTGAFASVVLAAIISLAAAIPLLIARRASLQSRLPFGPFLCLSGWIWVNFGPAIQHTFVNLLQLT